MLLGILTHSILLFAENKLFPITSGAIVNYKQLIEPRLALRRIADAVSGISGNVFRVGCILMLYPFAKVIHIVTFRKMLVTFLIAALAMLACSIPFGIADPVFNLIDYLLPIISYWIVILLFPAVLAIIKLVKRRLSHD